ncbi:hypothetical protein MMC22_006541 [Lobaria immixta]|nr:hypothetical protein [Lobaria immixta]
MAVKTSSTATSFPAHTFAKLSPQSFLHTTLTSQPPSRPSGRRPSQSRSPTCHASSLSHASGSAVMRIGDTAVVCGVRAEILLLRDIADYRPHHQQRGKTQNDTNNNDHDEEDTKKRRRQKRREDSEEMARLNLLVPNLELATGCSPAHLPGGPPSPSAQTLTQRILTLLHTSQLLDMDDLRILHHRPPPSSAPEEVEKMETSSDDDPESDLDDPARGGGPELKAFWTLYIDMVFISLDGSPFDAAWGSLLAALRDVRLPRAYWDEDRDCVLCDPDAAVARPLTLYGLPVAISFGVFAAPSSASEAASELEGGTATANTNSTATGKKWVLVDMDGFEEGLCAEGGTVVVDLGVEKDQVIRVEKSGGADVGVPEMKEMLRVASKRWSEWRDVLGIAR